LFLKTVIVPSCSQKEITKIERGAVSEWPYVRITPPRLRRQTLRHCSTSVPSSPALVGKEAEGCGYMQPVPFGFILSTGAFGDFLIKDLAERSTISIPSWQVAPPNELQSYYFFTV